MELTIRKIIVILLLVMTAVFAVWEMMEKFFLHPASPDALPAFYLIRGLSTAALMTMLTAYLMIHYRRRFEDELRRQSEESRRMRVFFENIVQDAGDGIISLDNDGIIRSWNRAAERIYGYPASEIVGQRFHNLVPLDLLEAGEPQRLRDAVEQHGFIRNYDTQRVRKDGTLITVRITRSILRDGDGRMIGSSAIVRDITAEKEMEARLIQSEKLAAIGQAAASTAHEVRNALAGIWGTIEVLQRTAAWRELPPDVGDEVKNQLDRIAHIISDLLAYARPAGPFRSRTDIHEVLDRVIAAVSSTPDSAGKTVRRHFADGGLFADVDPIQIEQAFQNLIINAYQAMEAGGTLEVATNRDADGVQIRFTDTGAGMSRDTLSRALEPFFTTKAKGTGLGLAIVRTIVEAHRGTLDLASEPRRGTTVTLGFPSPEGGSRASGASRQSAA